MALDEAQEHDDAGVHVDGAAMAAAAAVVAEAAVAVRAVDQQSPIDPSKSQGEHRWLVLPIHHV